MLKFVSYTHLFTPDAGKNRQPNNELDCSDTVSNRFTGIDGVSNGSDESLVAAASAVLNLWRLRISGVRGYEPVSYTHLDVYKRQGYELSSGEDISLYPVGSYQIRIEQGGLLYLDAKGREHAWHETDLLSARIISRSSDSLILGDKDSAEFVVAKEAGIVFADKVKSRAVGADLRGNDLLILDQGKDNKGEIRYYNLAHREMKFKMCIRDSVDSIRSQIEETTSDFDREKLQERLAKLSGGVAVIKVGAATETEMKEKKLRIEDALSVSYTHLDVYKRQV